MGKQVAGARNAAQGEAEGRHGGRGELNRRGRVKDGWKKVGFLMGGR